MGSDDRTQVGELDLEVAGQKIRTKGYRLMDIVCLAGAFGIGYVAVMLTNYIAEAKAGGQTIAQVLKESNQEIAKALKESQAANAEAMKQVAQEQRRANEIGREQTCLLTLPPDRRTNAGDFCKRLSRERDR